MITELEGFVERLEELLEQHYNEATEKCDYSCFCYIVDNLLCDYYNLKDVEQ